MLLKQIAWARSLVACRGRAGEIDRLRLRCGRGRNEPMIDSCLRVGCRHEFDQHTPNPRWSYVAGVCTQPDCGCARFRGLLTAVVVLLVVALAALMLIVTGPGVDDGGADVRAHQVVMLPLGRPMS